MSDCLLIKGHLDNSIIDLIYPIGSIYMSTNSVNPTTLFGGTWEALEGRFLVGADTTYTAGSTGGSATMSHTHSVTAAGTVGNHTLTIDEIPAHKHTVEFADAASYAGYPPLGTSNSNNIRSKDTSTVGGGQAHNHGFTGTAVTSGAASNDNNLPPYLAVYMWKRVA